MTITIYELRRRAARFDRRIRWRNIREYAVGAAVIALFAAYAFYRPGWRAIPQWLLIAGTIYVLFQLHRRGPSRPSPEAEAFAPTLAWHRAELERQRDALRAVWSWYLLPLVPGLIATLIVSAIEKGINAFWYAVLALFAAVLAGVWGLNQWAARRLEQTIEELRSVEEDH